MKLRELKIKNKTARIPIIQGGMGVGVSRFRLAGAVAKEGGVGMIPVRRSDMMSRILNRMCAAATCVRSKSMCGLRRNRRTAVWSA